MKRALIITAAVCIGLTACGFDGSIEELPVQADSRTVQTREKGEFEVSVEEYGFHIELPEELYKGAVIEENAVWSAENDIFSDDECRLILHSDAGDAGDLGARVYHCGKDNAFTFLDFGLMVNEPSEGVETRRCELKGGRRGYVMHAGGTEDHEIISGSYELDSDTFLNLTFRVNKNVRKALQEQRVREAWDSLLTLDFDETVTAEADFGEMGRLRELVPIADTEKTGKAEGELYKADSGAGLEFSAEYSPSAEDAASKAEELFAALSDSTEKDELISRCGVKGSYFCGKDKNGVQTAMVIYPAEDGGALTLCYTYHGKENESDDDLAMRMKSSLKTYER